MQWSIQQIARLSGTTSRTLRHYDDLGLLPPSSIGANGYRHYDEAALTRLQRILMLRDLGLGLSTIAEVLAGQTDDAAALTTHLGALREERDRLERQIASVTTTVRKMEGGEQLMAEEMLDGFDHTAHQGEVTERWGGDAYARGDRWWRGLGAEGQARYRAETAELQSGFAEALERATSVDDPAVQSLVARHYAWIRESWGGVAPTAVAYLGLSDMYVADPRFAKHYGGIEGAEYVRDAMRVYAASELA